MENFFYMQNVLSRGNNYNVIYLCNEGLFRKFNEIKVDGDGTTPMENFSGTTTYITFKNHHTWGCPVYVLDAMFQGNIAGLPKWETRSPAGIYLGHLPFNTVSVSLVLNQVTIHVSPQFYVVFDDEFSTVLFMR